jgi:hypothetical protein
MKIQKSTIRFRNETEIENMNKAREMHSDKTDNDIFNIAIDTLVNKVQEMKNEVSELSKNRALEREKFQELKNLAIDLFNAENTAFLRKQSLFKNLDIIE